MDKIINTRISEETLIEIKKIAEKENLDVSTVVRRFILKAMNEWRKDYALEQYKKGKFSFGQASRFAGIDAMDFPELLKQKKVPLNLDEEEFDEEMKSIKRLR